MSQTEVQLIKDAVIVNADISNSAAIDVSKISGAMPLSGGTFTNDVIFTGTNANIQFDKTADAIEFLDNAEARFGTGDDLKIFHNGTDSRITNTTGALQITGNNDFRLKTNSGQNIFKATGSAVELYFDTGSGSSKKIETVTDGAYVYGNLLFGVGTTGNLQGGDNDKIILGSGNDLQLYHNGTHNYIYSYNGNIELRHALGGQDEPFLKLIPNGAVELFHNSTKRLETTSYGNASAGQVRVTSSNAATVAFSVGDVGTGFYNTGSNTIGYSANGTQTANIDSAGNYRFFDNVKAAFGTGNDLQIFHDGSVDKIESNGGGMHIRQINNGDIHIHAGANSGASNNRIVARSAGQAELHHSGSLKMETTSNGVKVNNRTEIVSGGIFDNTANGNNCGITFNGDGIRPTNGAGTEIDNARDLGNPSKRWRNLYAVTLYGDGSNLTGISSGGGFTSSQQFTSNGTWTKPSGINTIRVYVTGGGGGAGGGGAGGGDFGGAGGAGGTAIEIIDVSSVSSVTVTVGGGGSGGAGAGNGGTGGTSSFGSYCSATGGGGGVQGNFGANKGGDGGVGSGGNINLTGGDGGAGQDNPGISTQYATAFGVGGASYWGGGGCGSSFNSGPETGKAYGSGGGAAHSAQFNTGAAGKGGFVYVEQYT